MSYLTGKYVKKNGKLVAGNQAFANQLERYIHNIPDGMLVEVFYEVQHDDGTLPQLAKLHVMIRSLATHLGYTVEDLKLLVKDRAGLCLSREVEGKSYFLAKSFGECSKEELSLAIQAAIEIGEEVNFLLN